MVVGVGLATHPPGVSFIFAFKPKKKRIYYVEGHQKSAFTLQKRALFLLDFPHAPTHLELHSFGQAADVVVRLDGGGGALYSCVCLWVLRVGVRGMYDM